MKKILTIILDGFGYREEEEGNAIKQANMLKFNELWQKYPHTLLGASEEFVGLAPGQMGNSEIGHMTIGAGKKLKSNEILVNEFLANVSSDNESIQKLLTLKDKKVHLMGLCSDGNVHAGVDDFLNMFDFLVNNGFKDIIFHLMTDGRDTDMHSAKRYIDMIKDAIKEKKTGVIATICGRYYGMDRDEHWDRTKKYYDLVVNGIGTKALNADSAIKEMYAKDITDEYITPIVLANDTIKDGDVVIWMNYRADRARQIMEALVNFQEFSPFPVKDLSNTTFFSLFAISKKIKTNYFLEPSTVKQPLGIYLSSLDFTQARIAESEKYPHVTYFFDGGYDGKIDKCDKFHIASPQVETYDLKPEMSCIDVTKKVIYCMNNDYDFILVNFANPDMVGHTGNMDATILALEAVDMCLGKIMEKAEENFYKVIILADHGNADTMLNPDGSPCTTHSTALVPFIICDPKVKLNKNGSLYNVAPTILDYMDIAVPKEMEGTESLLIEE